MKVELAKTAGFCFGVKRAVDTVYEQVKEHKGEKERAGYAVYGLVSRR